MKGYKIFYKVYHKENLMNYYKRNLWVDVPLP